MKIGQIQPKEINEEMRESYLDYAMSVIVSRALPDVRDGLKPVQRRILYAMWSLGLKSGAKFRKSATVVGEVLGKYHPHGDIPVYESLARMAQDFSLRYPLIDGQGNFGSLDGDSPAAMRYTEARLSQIAEQMLYDIEKETVDWIDNYDGTRQEPVVLPSKIPQLLLNGSTGIAVGMATKIPPHNLSELVEAICYLIDHPKATTEELMAFIKGPDFPTGGAIYDRKAIIHAYSLGSGPIIIRAHTEIIENKKGHFQIIIHEIPYQVNKSSLLQKIADLVKNKKLLGIKDIRDETDRSCHEHGWSKVRIVIDLKNDAYPQKVLNRLFKYTDLQTTFHLNMLALVDGIQPQVLPLKNALEYFVKHRQEIVRRRSEFDLARAKERAHILAGLKKALDKIDAIIKTIKSSRNRELAHRNLMRKFKFTDIQATAILEMKLQTLAGLERKKIEEELKEKLNLIKKLELLLKSPKKILEVIKNELQEIKKKFGDERRTRVFVRGVSYLSNEDLIPKEACMVILTKGGYIKRTTPKEYRTQRRGGRGVLGITTREGDSVEQFLIASTHDDILFFTSQGRVFQVKAYEVPEASRIARGQAIVNFLQIRPSEQITAIVPVSSEEKEQGKIKYLVMATQNGIIKKTVIDDFKQVRRSGLIAIKLDGKDHLGWVRAISGQHNIIIVTRRGQSICFSEKDIRPMGRNAAGVRGIKLQKNDEVVAMDVFDPRNQNDNHLLVVTEKGFGKRTKLKFYKKQRRGGVGIKTMRLTPKNGLIVKAKIVSPEVQDLIIISAKGQIIRINLRDIPDLSRSTQGVKIMNVKSDDKIVSIACL